MKKSQEIYVCMFEVSKTDDLPLQRGSAVSPASFWLSVGGWWSLNRVWKSPCVDHVTETVRNSFSSHDLKPFYRK